MNKTQRKLENVIIAQREDIERQERQLQVEYDLVDTLTEQADASDRLHKHLMADEKARHAAEKLAATEAATLKSIANGFVPIGVLRDLTGAEYTTEHCRSFTKTNLTVMLNAAKPVDRAILAALLEKPKVGHPYPHVTFSRDPAYPKFKVGDKVNVTAASDGYALVTRVA